MDQAFLEHIDSIVSLFNQTTVSHSQYWMFFIVVVFGILGYCFTEKYNEIEKLGICILVVGFVAFSIYNAVAMYQNVVVYNYLLKTLQSTGINRLDLATSIFEEKSEFKIIFSQNIFSLLTILVIIRKYISRLIDKYIKTSHS
jgi:hypothetical protein